MAKKTGSKLSWKAALRNHFTGPHNAEFDGTGLSKKDCGVAFELLIGLLQGKIAAEEVASTLDLRSSHFLERDVVNCLIVLTLRYPCLQPRLTAHAIADVHPRTAVEVFSKLGLSEIPSAAAPHLAFWFAANPLYAPEDGQPVLAALKTCAAGRTLLAELVKNPEVQRDSLKQFLIADAIGTIDPFDPATFEGCLSVLIDWYAQRAAVRHCDTEQVIASKASAIAAWGFTALPGLLELDQRIDINPILVRIGVTNEMLMLLGQSASGRPRLASLTLLLLERGLPADSPIDRDMLATLLAGCPDEAGMNDARIAALSLSLDPAVRSLLRGSIEHNIYAQLSSDDPALRELALYDLSQLAALHPKEAASAELLWCAETSLIVLPSLKAIARTARETIGKLRPKAKGFDSDSWLSRDIALALRATAMSLLGTLQEIHSIAATYEG